MATATDPTVMIQWSEKLSVGVPSIDKQHMTLVGMVNELYAAMRKGQGKETAGPILQKLIHYTKGHFTAEEGLMSMAGYASLPEHRKQHQELTRKVLDFKERYDRGSTGLSISVLNFLSDWLTNHIQCEDKHYGSCLTERGIR